MTKERIWRLRVKESLHQETMSEIRRLGLDDGRALSAYIRAAVQEQNARRNRARRRRPAPLRAGTLVG